MVTVYKDLEFARRQLLITCAIIARMDEKEKKKMGEARRANMTQKKRKKKKTECGPVNFLVVVGKRGKRLGKVQS